MSGFTVGCDGSREPTLAARSRAMLARAGYGLPQHGQTSARDAGSGSLRMAAVDPVGTRVIEPGRLVGTTVGPVVALDVVRTMTLVE